MQDDLWRASRFAIGAAAAFALMAACVKSVAADTSNEVVVFVRSLTALLVLLPWMLRRGPATWRTTRLSGHLWRAGFGICAMYCFFYTLASLPLAEALMLTYSTPLFTPFIAWAWIRERPPLAVFPAAALGLAGIALIVKPSAEGFLHFASLIGIASGLFAAAAMVSIRRISDTEPATRIVFHFALLSTLISAVPLSWAWTPLSPATLTLLVAVGILATLGQLCLTRAYALAAAARVGPFIYTSVIFAGLIGWALWGERPDGKAVFGMVLVVACCALVGSARPRTAN